MDKISSAVRKRNPRLDRAGVRRGFTLVELLVALAIVAAFSAGVIAAFIQILRASDRAEVSQ
ncbi:MAG: prepilin-type N-terminal cleavage/methylation domain-containing protein [bacterium]